VIDPMNQPAQEEPKTGRRSKIAATLTLIFLSSLLFTTVGIPLVDLVPHDNFLGDLIHRASIFGFSALSYFPAYCLWTIGYRGSLIAWGDGWVWLTLSGSLLVYGLPALLLGWYGRAVFLPRRRRRGTTTEGA